MIDIRLRCDWNLTEMTCGTGKTRDSESYGSLHSEGHSEDLGHVVEDKTTRSPLARAEPTEPATSATHQNKGLRTAFCILL